VTLPSFSSVLYAVQPSSSMRTSMRFLREVELEDDRVGATL
jgi:hypothetical protein